VVKGLTAFLIQRSLEVGVPLPRTLVASYVRKALAADDAAQMRSPRTA
jgi:hypothetical protein